MAKSTDNQGTANKNDGKNVTEIPQKRMPICRLLLACIVVIVAILLGFFLRERRHRVVEMEEIFRTHFGDHALHMFKSFDRDGDGYIDIFEFEPIIARLIETEANEPFSLEEEEIDPTEEVLTIQAFFKPLLQETMSKNKDSYFSANANSLIGLNDWKAAQKPIESFAASKFKAFLPDQAMPVGEAYTVIASSLNLLSSQLSSNRFYPPRIKGKEVVIFQLLSMFHERPFVRSRFAPQGSVAVIRAQNDLYVDIAFRIHAEFQLNRPPSNPFWFTPGQFTGNIIMRKDVSHIRTFHLYVPTNRSLNVDMEWLNGPSETENMEVDIGFMPLMELDAQMPSEQITLYDENGNILSRPDPSRKHSDDHIVWDEEVTQEQALKALEVKLYPFKKVAYHPFEEAFQKAESEKKLVHSLLLWGALDDQSC